MSDPESCVSCGEQLTGRFCATCGEKRPEPYSSWVRPLVEHKIAVKATTMYAYAVEFDRYIGLEAHALVLMVVPFFFVAVVLLVNWRRPWLVDHVIFSLHFCAFWLLFQVV